MKIYQVKQLWDMPLAWLGGSITLGATDVIVSIVAGLATVIFIAFRTYYLIRDNKRRDND